MTPASEWRTAHRSFLLAAGIAVAAHAQTALFIPIPAPAPGQNIAPFGISDDGSTVVGIAGPAGPTQQAFRWTPSGGMQLLWQGLARDTSADGSVIVGGTGIGTPGQAVRWTSGGGVQFLGAGEARAVSANGTVVVGGTTGITTDGQAFRWTTGGGLQFLPPPTPGLGATAADVSADGSIVTGHGATAQSHAEAFRWSAGSGTIGLGAMPGAPHIDTIANAISADGAVIAGFGHGMFLGEPFRHTAATGMVGLGALPGMTGCIAYDASGDGSILVGAALVGSFSAMIWNEQHGLRTLQQVLADDFGLTLPGWNLEFANAISVDGTRIVGFGTNPLGQREGFLVIIPAPPAIALLALSCAACARRARMR